MNQEVKLLQAAQKGDASAFERIVENYQSLVCAITFSGTGQVEVSEELAQETFLSAWKNLRQLTDLRKFKPWLCTIARNMLNSHYRQKKAIPLDSVDIGELSDQTSTPSDHLIVQEEHVMLEQTLMQLPVEYREPLVMYYRQEKSTREVAAALGLNESTVRTRLHRARQMLREEIAARLEQTIERTGPGKAFTRAVMVAVAGGVVGMSACTNTASAAAHSVGTSASTGITAAMSTLNAKIVTVAAGFALIVGATLVYRHLLQPELTNLVETHEVKEEVPSEVEQVIANAIEIPETQAVVMANNQVEVDSPQSEPDSISRDVEVNATSEYVFAPKGVLSGLVTDRDTGEPVVGAEIVIYGTRYPNSDLVTDSNGFYFLETIQESKQCRLAINSKDHIGKPNIDDDYSILIENDQQKVVHFQLERACMADLWVKDEQGDPIVGAKIKVIDLANGQMTAATRGELMSNGTDEDGYTLIGGHPASNTGFMVVITHEGETGKLLTSTKGYQYRERKPDFAPAHVVIDTNNPDTVPVFDVVMKKGHPIEGIIGYSDGMPASDLEIVAVPHWWSQTNLSGPRTEVAPDGRFILSHVTPEKYLISAYYPVKKSYHRIQTIDFSQTNEELCLTLNEPSPQSLFKIKGIVKVVKKAPVGNLYINIDAYNTTTKSHASRTSIWDYDENDLADFELNRLPEGNYRVTFQSEHFNTVVLDDIVPPVDDLYVEMEQRVKPEIEVLVVDKATGEPVADMKARLIKTAIRLGSHYSVTEQWLERSNSQGRAVFTATPGVYQVQVMADDYCLGISEEVDTNDLKPVTIELTQGGSITGTILNTERQPVEGAEVLALSYAGGNSLRDRNEFVAKTHAVESDLTGRFVIENIPEGFETLKVIHPDYSPAIVRDVAVVEGQTTEDVIVALEEEAILDGYVFDNQGNAVAGVRIDYDQDRERVIGREGINYVVTDANGYYLIGGLGSSSYFMARNRGSFTDGVTCRTITPVCGEVTRVDFGGDGYVISGTLVSEDSPAANMKLALRSKRFGKFVSYTITDSEGCFVFTGIPEGEYKLRPANNYNTVLDSVNVIDTDIDLGVIQN